MWNIVLEQFLPVFFMIVTPPLTVFVGLMFKKIASKWHLEGALQYEDTVNELVIKGIKAAEQKSIAAVKKGGQKTAGEQKVEDALKFVRAQLVAMKLPDKAASELVTLIEAHVFAGAKDKPNALPAPVLDVDPTPAPAQTTATA